MSGERKSAQNEYKIRHGWVGKVIHWELLKKLKFDHTDKWYMHISRIRPGEWDEQISLGF